MRFDDKKPLNKDLDETLSVVSTALDNSAAVQQALENQNEENSVGEENPFSFFEKDRE